MVQVRSEKTIFSIKIFETMGYRIIGNIWGISTEKYRQSRMRMCKRGRLEGNMKFKFNTQHMAENTIKRNQLDW